MIHFTKQSIYIYLKKINHWIFCIFFYFPQSKQKMLLDTVAK